MAFQAFLRFVHKPAQARQFLVKEDEEILGKVLYNKVSWDELSSSVSRPRNAVLYRWHNKLKPAIIAKSVQLNTSLNSAIQKELENLKTRSPQGVNTVPKVGQWTNDMDQRLIKAVHKYGLVFSIMTDEFPEFSSGQLSARYNLICPHQYFSPEDLRKLETGMKKYAGNSSLAYSIHMSLLPKHSPWLISKTIKELKAGVFKMLNHEEIEYISVKVSKYGRLYFYLGDPELKLTFECNLRELLALWAFYEPVDQENPVWSTQVDSAVLQYFKTKKRRDLLADFFANELDRRIYLLSTSDEPELKSRWNLS